MRWKQTLFGMILFSFLLQVQLHAHDILGRGASFPSIVYKDWANAYEEATGKSIQYFATGSGDGIISIKHRAVDFGGSDKPLQSWRLRRYGLSMFPTIIGSIVLAYNLPGVADNALHLSEKAIGEIFTGEVKFWDDPVIVENNAKLQLPHEPIRVIVRSDGSGTTYNFTYYLRKIDYKHFRKAKKSFDWQADVKGAEGNSGVAKSIFNTPYSIGYVDYAHKKDMNLTAAVLQNREGYWVAPSLEACRYGAQYSKLHMDNDFSTVIAYPKGKRSYPLIATSFILLPDEKKEVNPKVIDFYRWVFANGEEIAKKHGYAFLPKSIIEEIKFYWQEREL